MKHGFGVNNIGSNETYAGMWQGGKQKGEGIKIQKTIEGFKTSTKVTKGIWNNN